MKIFFLQPKQFSQVLKSKSPKKSHITRLMQTDLFQNTVKTKTEVRRVKSFVSNLKNVFKKTQND